LECPYEIMNYYCDKDWDIILSYGLEVTENRSMNVDDLFVQHAIYNHDFDLLYSLAAYYSGRYQLANDINQRNILRNKTRGILGLLMRNQKFIDDKILDQKLIALSPSNSDIRPAMIIIDNFYTDPDKIREIALKAEFNVYGNYPGVRTKTYATDELKNRFETIIGKRITYWPDDYNGSFQYTLESQKSWVHRDMTDYSGIVYMTPNPPINSGTVLYKHKASGKQYAANKAEEAMLSNDSGNEDAWEIMDVIGNKYNRCILFDGRCSHKSNVYFGTNKENGRLFQTFFFNTLGK